MTLQQFQKLNLDRQAKVAGDHGIFLASILEAPYIISLNQVFRFYVEEYWNGDTIEKINSFDTIDGFEPYLNEVDISALLKGNE